MPLHLTRLTDLEARPFDRRIVWLASGAGDVTVGAAYLRLYADAGRTRRADLHITVHPAERRAGAASQMLGAALAAARDDGRGRVISRADAGSPGDHFLAARGFRSVLTLVGTRLPLADVDPAALAEIAARPHAGYRLVSWTGTVPDDLAPSFALARHAMDDMPLGDLDFGTVTWDVAGVRAVAEAIAARGDRLYTVAAVDTSDGSVAGFTELVVPGDGTGDGETYSTGVLPGHRGHGLGGWMKAAAIGHVREHVPGLGGLVTDTAAENAPMRRINADLGYVRTGEIHQYQLDL